MLTDQASPRVQVPQGELFNLLGNIKNLMRKHDMMRDDLCHLRASKCHLWHFTRRSEIEVKPPTIAYPALHPRILSLVNDMHGYVSMQTACRLSTRPILHSSTRPRRLIIDSSTTGHTRASSLPAARPNL